MSVNVFIYFFLLVVNVEPLRGIKPLFLGYRTRVLPLDDRGVLI